MPHITKSLETLHSCYVYRFVPVFHIENPTTLILRVRVSPEPIDVLLCLF